MFPSSIQDTVTSQQWSVKKNVTLQVRYRYPWIVYAVLSYFRTSELKSKKIKLECKIILKTKIARASQGLFRYTIKRFLK